MKGEALDKEIATLIKFFEIYCKDKHQNQQIREKKVDEFEYKVNLCDECFKLFEYSTQRLQECTLDPKPKCRNCKDNCYEIDKRKQMGKMMKYSGIKLGLSKIKKLFKK